MSDKASSGRHVPTLLLPPKAKVTRSNRVGCASFFLSSSAVCARGLEFGLCLIPASKQSGGKSSPRAESLATDDVGRKVAGPRATIDSINSWIGALGQPNPRYLIQIFRVRHFVSPERAQLESPRTSGRAKATDIAETRKRARFRRRPRTADRDRRRQTNSPPSPTYVVRIVKRQANVGFSSAQISQVHIGDSQHPILAIGRTSDSKVGSLRPCSTSVTPLQPQSMGAFGGRRRNG